MDYWKLLRFSKIASHIVIPAKAGIQLFEKQ